MKKLLIAALIGTTLTSGLISCNNSATNKTLSDSTINKTLTNKVLSKSEINEVTSLDSYIRNADQWIEHYCGDLGIADLNSSYIKEGTCFFWMLPIDEMFKNEDGIYITEKTEELGYRNAILVDFDQIVSDEFMSKEKVNEVFAYFICYFEIEKVTKDDVYLKVKKIVFAEDYILDKYPLTEIY